MALFKIFKGNESQLNNVDYHQGYAYLCADTGNLFVDISNNAGGRIQVNAYASDVLIKRDSLGNIEDYISVDDLLLANAAITAEKGGTGRESLTSNALLVGNDTDPVKLVTIDKGSLIIGDETDGVSGFTLDKGKILVGDVTGVKGVEIPNGDILVGDTSEGIKGLNGVGVLQATESGKPVFNIAGIDIGGTGASNAADARTNLDVYNKSETAAEVNKASSCQYAITLYASNWSNLTYNYTNSNLVAKVPPLISCTNNVTEYSNITSAEATANVGIIFTASKKPVNDISLIITDIK